MMETSLEYYKLSCELWGHTKDVRSVSAGSEMSDGQTIISGSRDKVAKVWKPSGKSYIESATLRDHSNYISFVFYLENEQWICTGSNDSTVCIYREGSYELLFVLKGHTSTVCSIAAGVEARSLITGSWDKTARIWTIDSMGGYTSVQLSGHEAAVWAVASMTAVNNFITGSADKVILYWNAKGEKLRFLKGHTDCVRALLSINGCSLASCGNDAIIRYWNEEGECVRELSGHSNYIYAISQNKALGADIVVSCGEDSTLRMWNLTEGVELGRPIVHPAQSVWSVACLNNGDIVTGCSDGVIRVFTQEPTRVADASTLQAFEAAVTIREKQLNEELGDMKKTELPGPEILLKNGTKEGQTIIVRNPDGLVNCYCWQQGKWSLVGEVTGASGGSHTSDKKQYEGKEYDFVFSVDISDSDPPIKLPYNRGDDPWQAAQAFIHRNNLPQVYLDQIANFIIKNSGAEEMPHNTLCSHQDPFTGGSRYVPGTSSNYSCNADPLAAESTLYPTGGSAEGSDRHFPVRKYLVFENCDPSKILDKLKEFNNKLTNANEKVSDILLEAVVKLADETREIDKSSIEALQHLLYWPKDILFPVLDVTRLAVQSEPLFTILNSFNFLEIVLPKVASSGPNQLMIVRCLNNMMCHEAGRKEVDKRLTQLVDVIVAIKSGSANLQIAVSTFYLNLTISQTLESASGDKCRIFTKGIIELLKWAVDLEACYRAMQAIGNLTVTPFWHETAAQVISADCVMNRIRELANTPQSGSFAKLNAAGLALLASF